MKPKEIFWSGLKGGIFEQKHYKAMGDALWLFGYLCMRQSQVAEKPDGTLDGLPHYGNPLTDKQLHDDTGWPIRTIQYWRQRLVLTGYIRTLRMGNLGLVYFIHKAKRKARNPKPSTRYFPAELQPNGNYKATQRIAGPGDEVPQALASTYAKSCTTYADKPLDSQADTQITNTLTPKHLSNYKTEAPTSSLLKATAREMQREMQPQKQTRSLQEQKEELRRRGFLPKEQPGKVLEMQPKEAIA